jgi:methylase of polypeptide subunit release factors
MALETDKDGLSLSSKTRPLRILDLCTGTGCIALLLHALLASHFEKIQIMGLDLSPIALNLAHRNLEHNISLDALGSRAREEVQFHGADVLRSNSSTSPSAASDISTSNIPTVEDLLFKYITQPNSEPQPTHETSRLPKIDLLISNPPYVSTTDFHNGTTARSVRLFEPRLALVPPTDAHTNTNAVAKLGDKPEDIFYRRILGLSLAVEASVTVLECGDRMQAERVVGMFWGMSGSRERQCKGDGGGDGFTAEVWPDTEEDCLANGFHGIDGSRCVIIRRVRGGIDSI